MLISLVAKIVDDEEMQSGVHSFKDFAKYS